ncbi:MAG: tRNA (adenosine(37)-N6)-threonylcarbamoyltransferase complex dimerization subunit type 1 TsaB [Chloroflexota bacterium]
MILAIDTATNWTGLAIHDGSAVLAELGWRSHRNQTVELASAVDQIWAQAQITAADLEAIAVAIGPGSYTGLRVGLALAKGLALGHKLPLVGVPTLDIVAAGIGRLDEPLVITAEAGRNRLWAGTYRWSDRRGWQPEGDPHLTDWETLLTAVEEPTVFAGEISPDAAKAIRRTSGARLISPAIGERRAAVLAEIGYQRWKSRAVTEADQLIPLYLREPS